MNTYKTEADYYSFIERWRAARNPDPWSSGTIMTTLNPRNILKETATSFSNANPNPNCSYRKSKRHKH